MSVRKHEKVESCFLYQRTSLGLLQLPASIPSRTGETQAARGVLFLVWCEIICTTESIVTAVMEEVQQCACMGCCR